MSSKGVMMHLESSSENVDCGQRLGELVTGNAMWPTLGAHKKNKKTRASLAPVMTEVCALLSSFAQLPSDSLFAATYWFA
jgi:hypothetical protein